MHIQASGKFTLDSTMATGTMAASIYPSLTFSNIYFFMFNGQWKELIVFRHFLKIIVFTCFYRKEKISRDSSSSLS